MTANLTSKFRCVRRAIPAIVVLAGWVWSSSEVFASTSTWNNFTNASNGWVSTTANWLPAAYPTRSVDLVLQFSSQSADYTSTNNFTGTPFTLNSFVFVGSGTSLTTIGTPNVALAFSSSSASVAPSIVQNSAGSFFLQGNGGISLASGDLHLSGSGTGLVTLKAIVSGTNGLIVDGTAAFALTGAHTYSGGTTVQSGVLRLGTDTASVLGTGALNFNGGTITSTSSTATKTISNAINIGTNKTATFGDTNAAYNGKLVFSGGVAIGQNATVRVNSNVDLNNAAGPTLADNVAFDIASTAKLTLAKLDVSNDVTLDLDLGASTTLAITGALTGNTGTLNFVLNGGTAGGTYTLLTFGSNTLSYSNLNFVSGTYSLDTTYGNGGWLLDGTSLQVRVVPEPSAWLLAALGVGVLLVFRKRQKAGV